MHFYLIVECCQMLHTYYIKICVYMENECYVMACVLFCIFNLCISSVCTTDLRACSIQGSETVAVYGSFARCRECRLRKHAGDKCLIYRDREAFAFNFKVQTETDTCNDAKCMT